MTSNGRLHPGKTASARAVGNTSAMVGPTYGMKRRTAARNPQSAA